MNLLLGIDIGGTKSAVLVGTASGEVLERREWPSRAERGPAAMLEDVEQAASELLAKHAGVVAAGVSIGGPLDAVNGIIHSPPNLPGWDAIPLKALLQERLKLPVAVAHDAAACALAETLWGEGRGAARVVYLTCGTGFGAGLVLDGKIYAGARGASPEIGHLRYRDGGPEAYGKAGSYEAYCSGSGLGKLAAWFCPERWGACPPQGPELSALAAGGDADAARILQINATAVGDACALLADLLRPDCILLGSLARYLGGPWLAQVQARFEQESLPGTLTRIAPASLGERLQDASALAAALDASHFQSIITH